MRNYKDPMRARIVKDRFRAKSIWNSIQLPDTIHVRNDKEGERQIPIIVDVSDTVKSLRDIGRRIFEHNENNHYVAISIDDPRRMSFCRKLDDKFSSSRRVKISLNRYITRQFTDIELNERAVEMFTEKFSASACSDLDNCFWIESGEDILKRYINKWGGSSCMTGGDAEYVSAYSENKNCNMLLFNDGDYIGRALLWDTNEGDRILDRIYPNSGPHIEKYYAWCEKRGIPVRTGNYCPCSEIDSDGTYPNQEFSNGKKYSITLKNTGSSMPYMDSFHWGHSGPGRHEYTCYTDPAGNDCEYMFSSVCGEMDTFTDTCCDVCGSRRYLRETEDGHECSECFWESRFSCEKCDSTEHSEEEYRINMSSGSTISVCEECANENYYSCDKCGEYVDAIQYADSDEDEEKPLCESCCDN